MEVRFEHLCTDPVNTLAALARFLGLEMEPGLLDPLSLPHAKPSRSDWAMAKVNKTGELQLTPHAVGYAWPSGWNQAARMEFMSCASDLMCDLGYLIDSGWCD